MRYRRICFLLSAVQAPQYYKAMEDTMVRRGPDQAGRWGDDHCVLLHRRLAVIDPARQAAHGVDVAGPSLYYGL